MRTSKPLTRLLKECRYVCSDLMCGHTFVAYLEVKYTTSPAARPNKEVHLPISAHVERKLIAQSLRNELSASTAEKRGEIRLASAPDINGALLSSEQVEKMVAKFLGAYKFALLHGTFPLPFHTSGQHSLWREADVQAWIEQRAPRKRMAA